MNRTRRYVLSGLLCALAILPIGLAAQFDDIKVPDQMTTLSFMLGDWGVDGLFRTPDHIGSDRTLWYLTRGGGITRFNGTAWTAFSEGDSNLADSLLAQITARAEPYEFSNTRTVRPIQDGFALLIDEGRTSGSVVIHFDVERSAWVATHIHAPTNSVTTSLAPQRDGLPIFEGQATDRRGDRIFHQAYEKHDADHYTVRTDISFDEGETWIEEQIVLNVKRKLQ